MKRAMLKSLIFLFVVVAVQYPSPRRLVRHLRHVSDLNAMIDSRAPQLAAWEQEFRATRLPRLEKAAASRPTLVSATTPAASRPVHPRAVLHEVERFVYDKVRYEWDWNTWNVADYLPTVAEIFDAAARNPDGLPREDCDGRALLAASLLARMGYDARLVTDFRHMWVRVEHAATGPDGRPAAVELMGPGRAKSVVSTASGNRFDWRTLSNLPVAWSFGVAVFPWGREAIVFATLMILLMHRRMSRRAAAVGVLLAFAGWHFLRMGVVSVGQAGMPGYVWQDRPDMAWLGLAYVLLGCGVLWRAARRARRENLPAPELAPVTQSREA